MPTPFTRSLAMLGAAFMLAAAAGCSGSSQQNAGSVRVAVSSSALATGVTEVIVTVGPGTGLPSFTPFSVALSNVQGTWSGYITNIPAGTQRTFDVVANDSSHAQLQAGSGKADVAAGKSAVVVVTMGSTVPSNPFGNNAPVIDYVSASQTNVLPGGTVRLSISAHDPDPGDTVTILWSAACGTIDAPASSVVTWTAPAATGPCQITAKASDNRGASVSVYLSLDVAAATSGDVLVEVKDGGNASPVITAMTADVQYRSPVQGSLSVQATDPNGDTLAYAWSSNCATVTFATPAAATTTFTNSDGSKSCVVTVDVTDGKGGKVTGDVTLPPNILFNLAPVITHTVQPSVDLTDLRLAQPVSPGDAVLLSVEAKDPENLNLTFTWTTNAGTLDGQVDLPIPTGTPAPHVTTSPGKSVILFHVGATIPADAKVTVTVRDPGNEATSHDYNFKAATGTGPCASQPNGTTCDDGNPCTTTSSCQGGVCVGANPVVCAAPAACKQAGVCQTSGPSAGTCTYADSATGTACDDGRACTSPDTCAAGVCMSGPSTCTGGQTCSTAGVCVPGACVPACTGKTCGPDGCGGVCGTCTGTDVCSAAGTCGPPVCTPNCTGKTCGPDGCGGTCAPGCTGTNTCNASGACVASSVTVPRPSVAKQIQAKQMNALAMDGSGNTAAVGQVGCAYDTATNSCYSVPFDTQTVKPLGANDAYVVKYGPSGSHDAIWASLISGQNEVASATDQAMTGVAVLANGNVVALGTTNGGVLSTNLAINLPASGDQVFLATFGTSGAALWGTQFSVGVGNGQIPLGVLTSYQNRIAFCGYTDTKTLFAAPAFAFNPGSSPTTPNRDVIIAVYDVGAAGTATLAWSKQLGGGSDEACFSITFDDLGNLVAVGQYNKDGTNATFDPGMGPLPDPNGALANSVARRHLWVAKYDSTGTILAQASFGNTGANGAATPKAVTVDAGGNVYVAGSFTVALPLPGLTTATDPKYPLTSAGNTDAFVMKLTPATSTFTPAWADRVGAPGTTPDTASAVAVTSTGEALFCGTFNGPTTGAAVFPYTAGNGADAFLIKYSAGGAVQYSQAFGGGGSQGMSTIVVNRRATGANLDGFVFGGPYDTIITFPPLPALPLTAGASYVVWAPFGP